MKKIWLVLIAFVFIFCGNNAKILNADNDINNIEIKIQPEQIFLNNEIIIDNNQNVSYEFVLDDKIIDFNCNEIIGFKSDELLFEFYHVSNSNVISYVDNQISLLNSGESYVFYKGKFKTLTNLYTFKGKILIRIVEESINELTYLLINEENFVTYTAVLNNNDNYTKYSRKNIKWFIEDKIYYGNELIIEKESDLYKKSKNELKIVYDYQDEQKENLEVIINDLNHSIPDVFNEYWYIVDIVMIVLIVVLSFIYLRINNEAKGIENLNKYLHLFYKSNNQLIADLKIKKIHKKKIKKNFLKVYKQLFIAHQSAKIAINERYYEFINVRVFLEYLCKEYLKINKNLSKTTPENLVLKLSVANNEIKQIFAILYSVLENEKKTKANIDEVRKGKDLENKKTKRKNNHYNKAITQKSIKSSDEDDEIIAAMIVKQHIQKNNKK